MIAPPIEEIVQAGIAFNPRLRMPLDDVRAKVDALFLALDKDAIPYLLVGGVALLTYVHGRNTQDVDLILDAADLDRVAWEVTGRDKDFARADYQGLRVDLLLTDNALFDRVRRTYATTASFGERVVPCATREGIILLKLYALPSLYRQGEYDRAALYETDILMLHHGVDVDDDALLAVLAEHLGPSDVVELRAILEEQRGRRRFGAPRR